MKANREYADDACYKWNNQHGTVQVSLLSSWEEKKQSISPYRAVHSLYTDVHDGNCLMSII